VKSAMRGGLVMDPKVFLQMEKMRDDFAAMARAVPRSLQPVGGMGPLLNDLKFATTTAELRAIGGQIDLLTTKAEMLGTLGGAGARRFGQEIRAATTLPQLAALEAKIQAAGLAAENVVPKFRSLHDVIKSIATQFDGMSAGMQGMVGAIAGMMGFQLVSQVLMGVVDGFKQLVMGTKELADEQRKLHVESGETGLSVKAMETYKFAAAQTGVELGSLRMGMRMLVMQMEKNPKAFADLGISIKDATGKFLPLEEIMPQIMDLFKGVTNETQRLELASAMMGGRMGARLIPMLIEGSAAMAAYGEQGRAMGYIMDEVSDQRLVALSRELAVAELAIEGAKRQMQLDFVPVFSLGAQTMLLFSGMVRDAVLALQDLERALAGRKTDPADVAQRAIDRLRASIPKMQADIDKGEYRGEGLERARVNLEGYKRELELLPSVITRMNAESGKAPYGPFQRDPEADAAYMRVQAQLDAFRGEGDTEKAKLATGTIAALKAAFGSLWGVVQAGGEAAAKKFDTVAERMEVYRVALENFRDANPAKQYSLGDGALEGANGPDYAATKKAIDEVYAAGEAYQAGLVRLDARLAEGRVSASNYAIALTSLKDEYRAADPMQRLVESSLDGLDGAVLRNERDFAAAKKSLVEYDLEATRLGEAADAASGPVTAMAQRALDNIEARTKKGKLGPSAPAKFEAPTVAPGDEKKYMGAKGVLQGMEEEARTALSIASITHSALDSIFAGLTSGLSGTMDALIRGAINLKVGLDTIWRSIVTAFFDMIAKMIARAIVFAAIKGLLNMATGGATTLSGSVLGFAVGGATQAVPSGKVMAPVGPGQKAMAPSVTGVGNSVTMNNAINNLTTNTTNAVKNLTSHIEDNSSSSVTTNAINNLTTSVTNAVANLTTNIQKNNNTNTAISATTNTVNAIKNLTTNTVNAIRNSTTNTSNAVNSVSATKNLTTTITNAVENLTTNVSSTISNLASHVEDNRSSVATTSIIKNLMTSTTNAVKNLTTYLVTNQTTNNLTAAAASDSKPDRTRRRQASTTNVTIQTFSPRDVLMQYTSPSGVLRNAQTRVALAGEY